MKIRNNFVSNSSTTSFIILRDKTDRNQPIRIKFEFELHPYDIVETVKDLDAFVYDRPFGKIKTTYDKIKKLIEEGKVLQRFDVSSEGENDEAIACRIINESGIAGVLPKGVILVDI